MDSDWEVDERDGFCCRCKTRHVLQRIFQWQERLRGTAETLPERRGKNLASAPTVRAMSFLFEKGMESVALYTSEQNLSSMALLQKLGFKISHH